jgi:hypothetical protein
LREQDTEGSGPAADVDHMVGAQLLDEADIGGQIIALAVEGVVESRQAWISEDRIGHDEDRSRDVAGLTPGSACRQGALGVHVQCT